MSLDLDDTLTGGARTWTHQRSPLQRMLHKFPRAILLGMLYPVESMARSILSGVARPVGTTIGNVVVRMLFLTSQLTQAFFLGILVSPFHDLSIKAHLAVRMVATRVGPIAVELRIVLDDTTDRAASHRKQPPLTFLRLLRHTSGTRRPRQGGLLALGDIQLRSPQGVKKRVPLLGCLSNHSLALPWAAVNRRVGLWLGHSTLLLSESAM